MDRKYYPLGRGKLTPLGRSVWYQLDRNYPGHAYIGIEEEGNLVWAGIVHSSCVRTMDGSSFDSLLESYPEGVSTAIMLRRDNGKEKGG